MHVNSLMLPAKLVQLIRAGQWPSDEHTARMQYGRPLFTPKLVKTFAPDEFGVFLYPPPFHTILQERKGACGLSDEQYALGEIDPGLTVPIGDFGAGSDTVIALDFRVTVHAPSVIRLVWKLPEQPNAWQQIAPSFAEFWSMLSGARINPLREPNERQ